MTVTDPTTLRALVERSDDHPALVVPESGTSLSYAALQLSLDRAAGRLAAVGVGEGDRVALVAANGPALIVAFLAVGALGAAAAPLNPALGAAELIAELDDLRASHLLHGGVAKAVAAAAAARVPASVIGIEDGLMHIDGQVGNPLDAADDPDALALLLHTSGTTSKPKTVPIRQRNLVASTSAVAETYGLDCRRRDDVHDAAVPRPRARCRGVGHAVNRRHRGCAPAPAVHVLGRRSQAWRNLVHGRPDYPLLPAHTGP